VLSRSTNIYIWYIERPLRHRAAPPLLGTATLDTPVSVVATNGYYTADEWNRSAQQTKWGGANKYENDELYLLL
jgi:hypothetical protein